MLQKYELSDKILKKLKMKNCTEKGAIYGKYALDFREKQVYNSDKYEKECFFGKRN